MTLSGIIFFSAAYGFWAAILAYMAYKYVHAHRMRPHLRPEDILYEERSASARSDASMFATWGGPQRCVRLIVTRNWLLVTLSFPFAGWAPVLDMEHVVPKAAIENLNMRKLTFVATLDLEYRDATGKRHHLMLIPQDCERFVEALEVGAAPELHTEADLRWT